MAPQALQDLEQPTKPSRPAQPPAIRPAQTADIPALTRLEATCFDSDRLSRRSFQHMITRAKAAMFVIDAEGGGDLLGYGLVLFHLGTALARLYSLAVHSSARGRGFGLALLEHAEAAARRHDCVALRLEVRADNQAAIALYEGRG
ncbi:MAG TPA: N-acetyltransferase, partial [Thalassobaculum sp.]